MNTHHRKLVVLSVDALVWEDLEFAKGLPGFSQIMRHKCGVEKVQSVFPTLTYPVHVVQVTGQNIEDTGVYNNETFQPGRMEPDWCWDVENIKVPTIFDAAKKAGLTTCAIMWPVLAKADIDFSIPEVWNMNDWSDPEGFYQEYCSPKGYSYFLKHIEKLGWHPKPAYDEFAVCIAEDILRNEMPDVSFVHVSAIDIARHYNGVFCKEVDNAIERVDKWISRLLKAVNDAGYYDDTDFVICSDHGHMAITKEINLNVIFSQEGLLSLDNSGNLLDYDAYCHSASLSGQIMLKDPMNKKLCQKVLDLLLSLKADKAFGICEVYTKEEAQKIFHLSGPFSYVVEGEDGTEFGHACVGRATKLVTDADYTYVKTGHGYNPVLGPQPVFIASGPDFSKNVMLPSCSILDELPTLIKIFGIEMENLKGRVLDELLK